MSDLIKQYEDYYLIKCYAKKEYRTDFNKGIIYLNNLSFFHNVENAFQQDKEGEIFHQVKNSIGTFYIFDQIEGSEVSKLVKSGKALEEIKPLKKQSNKLGNFKDLRLSIAGYITCFYLIPKRCLKLSGKNIDISPINEYYNFFYFLNSYAKEQGYAFVCIYDAPKLIKKICDAFNDNNKYDFTYGSVTYQNVDVPTKAKWFKDGQFEKIAFTKSLKFKYQKEFRLFVSPKDLTTCDSIIINSDSFESTVVFSFDYATPEYSSKVKIVKKGKD